ncbi:MAG: DNA polymerase-3 subunit chi [Oceanicoccus sp.]|jgi:DNA polymerase-3 subunit chi
MTKVDFYILPEESVGQRHLFACRLADKAFKLGLQIYIHCDDNAQANALDQLLWSWRNSSFLPHQISTDDKASTERKNAAIQVGYENGQGTAATQSGLLINLSNHVPEFFSRFERLSEIVVQTDVVTTSTRANFRFYRNRGYQLETHDLRK